MKHRSAGTITRRHVLLVLIAVYTIAALTSCAPTGYGRCDATKKAIGYSTPTWKVLKNNR